MRHLLVLLAVISTVSIFAQTTYPISGKLRTKEGKEAIVGATIFVITGDNKLAAGTVSDEEGKFTVKLERGEYTLKINYLGTKPYEEELRVFRDDYLGVIEMEESTEALEGVNVREKAPQATVNGDTTSFSSKAYKTNQNASAKDLLEKMPGMQNSNGEIKAQGEKVGQVLVDGKSFFGQDPSTALATLPAEVVDKIQVFDDQSEQSKASGIDDGTRIKTVNIVTKINMRNGEFGKVYAGAGTDERYSAGGNINKFKEERRISLLGQVNNINQQNFSTEDLLGVVGDNSSGGRHGGHGPGGGRPSYMQGFSAGSSANDFMVNPSGGITKTLAGGINYQDAWGKKTEVSSSYFFNQGKSESISNTYQLYYLPDLNGQEYDEQDNSSSTNINHKFNAKVVYKISDKVSLFYIPSVSVQQNNGTSILSGITTQEATVINSLSQVLSSDLEAYNASNNLMLRLNGDKRGRSLFIQGRWDNSGSNGNKILNSSNIASDTNLIDQRGILDETTNGLTGSIAISEPIGDKGLGAFLNYDISNDNSASLTSTYSDAFGGKGGVFDSSLSSNYNNNWLTQTAAFGVRKFGKGGGFVARVALQNASLVNKQELPLSQNTEVSYFNILPFAIYRAKFKNNSSLFTMYRTYTTQPQASQLTEAIDNSNPLQLKTGNAGLSQQYGHWIRSRYNSANAAKSTIFYASVSGGIASNYIGTSTFTARRDTTISGVDLTAGSQISAPVNLDGQYNAAAFITYGFPVSKLKSNLNVNVGAEVNQIPSLINTRKSNTFNQNYSLGFVLSSNISEKIDFTISSETNFNLSENSINQALNNQYFVQVSKIKYDWIMPLGLTFRTQLQHQQFFGLSSTLDNTVLLWTAGIGKQLFKDKRGEIQLSMYDILNQNNSISQNFYDSYYQETNTNILTRYAMLSFSYNIRKFREAKPDAIDKVK